MRVYIRQKSRHLPRAAGMREIARDRNFAQIQEWTMLVDTSVENSRSAYPDSRGSSRTDQTEAYGAVPRTGPSRVTSMKLRSREKQVRREKDVGKGQTRWFRTHQRMP